MEVSPAKSLGVVSDSEGEEERVGINMDDLFEHEVNAARSTDPRDWHHPNQPATIATNLSSHISQFTTLPGQALAMQADSSAIGDFDSSATKPRPRPRPRMRPVPPPDQPESSFIDAFPTMPPVIPSVPEAVASFDNSAVQGVPAARPPSLPPSSLPGQDSSSSLPIPTFPASSSPTRPPPNLPAPSVTGTSSGVVPPSAETAPTAPKRPRPKMRPPPPPEPETTTATVTATSSATTTNFSTDPNNTTSTGATSASSASKSNPSVNSALEEAEEYTGRGARRLALTSKTQAPPAFDADVDVGGPEDNINDVIMLISSDDEYGGSKAKAKAKPKPKPIPKAKKKDAPDNPGEQVPAPLKSASKRKNAKLQSSDDEFGKWDSAIPGGSAPASERTKSVNPDPGNEDAPTAQPVVPNTIEPPNPNPPSSPLSSPGRSPELKRKDPPNPVPGETVAQSPTKKPRKPDFVGVVLAGPSSDGKKSKRPKKKSAKAAAAEEVNSAGNDQAYVPQALNSVADTSISFAPSEASKSMTTPPTSTEPSMVAQGPENVSMDIDGPAGKKPPKKRAPKGKKAAVAEEPVATDGLVPEDSAPTKATKGKGKGKGKNKEQTPTSAVADEVPRASSPNPDAGAPPVTSSNPSSNIGPQPTSSNPSVAPAQTPAPKPKAKPRHSTTPAPLPVAMGASGALLRSASGKSSDRPLSETLRLALGGSGSPAPRMGLSRRGSSKIAPLLAFRGAPPPPPPPMPKKPTKKKKGASDDEDSEEGPEWEGLTEKQKEKKRREKEMAGWYSDG